MLADIGLRRIDKVFNFKVIFRLPFWPVVVFLTIFSIGLLCMTSTSQGTENFARKEIVFFLILLPSCLMIVSINIAYIIRYSYIIYIASLCMLMGILVMGDVAMGARRWISFGAFKIQPSEFMKVTLLLAIARYYFFQSERNLGLLRSSIVPLILTMIPAALVMKQPDLGSGLVIVLLGISLIFLCGLKLRFFIISAIVLLSSLPLIWSNLHDYQKKRIFIFLYPENDKLGAGYNIIQSKIAIGSGGIVGKGPLNSSQGKLNFLPESHTDFAFTIFAEEFGFIGSIALISLYLFLIMYSQYIAHRSENHFERVMAIGISNLYFVHAFVNIAMTSGLVPVVGIPLPLISYGGSILASTMVSFAILLNIAGNITDQHLINVHQ